MVWVELGKPPILLEVEEVLTQRSQDAKGRGIGSRLDPFFFVVFVICVANRYHSFCKWLIGYDIACSKKDASRDAPATMGCLLWVGMSIPAHPHAIGRLAGILGIGHGEGRQARGFEKEAARPAEVVEVGRTPSDG